MDPGRIGFAKRDSVKLPHQSLYHCFYHTPLQYSQMSEKSKTATGYDSTSFGILSVELNDEL